MKMFAVWESATSLLYRHQRLVHPDGPPQQGGHLDGLSTLDLVQAVAVQIAFQN